MGDTWIHRYPYLNSFIVLRKAILRGKKTLFPLMGVLLKMAFHLKVEYFIKASELQNSKKLEKIIDISQFS